MELDKIIEALKDKDVDSAIIDAVKGLDQGEAVGKLTKELEAEKGKNAGILEDKKKFKERAEVAEKQLNELQEKDLSIEERTKKQLEDLQAKLDEAEAKRVEQETNFKAQQRESALSDIAGGINWTSSLPRDTAKLIVKNAFNDVDDLSDKSVVESKVKELTETHKAFIDAAAPSGTGAKSGNGASAERDGPVSMQDLVAEVWS